MAYERLKAKLAEHMVEAEEVREIIEAYVDDLEEALLIAKRSIQAPRDTAHAIVSAAEGDE